MLTARSEYRLHLRADNAVSRLAPMALALGTLGPGQLQLVQRHLEAKAQAASALEESATGTEFGLADPARRPLSEWARRDDVVDIVSARLPQGAAADEALDDAIYAPYLTRLRGEIAARAKDRALNIPIGFDLGQVPGLSNEMRERLAAAGPADLDQAARVPGITPAALSALHFALIRQAA